MNKVLNINKPIGITSYDVIRQLKKIYPGEKIGHAGTLDPLASGVLICLVGQEATRRQSEFMEVSKEYEFEVLFGFRTDTYDILGLVHERIDYDFDEIKTRLEELVESYPSKLVQRVPPFSAVKVDGKPLYRWYLDGRIKEVDVPSREVSIENLEILKIDSLNPESLQTKITDLIGHVKKGFRQKQVLQVWGENFEALLEDQMFLSATLKAKVSKGTYVRGIAHDLGQKLGVGACTATIIRTRVGDFDIEQGVGLAEL